MTAEGMLSTGRSGRVAETPRDRIASEWRVPDRMFDRGDVRVDVSGAVTVIYRIHAVNE